MMTNISVYLLLTLRFFRALASATFLIGAASIAFFFAL